MIFFGKADFKFINSRKNSYEGRKQIFLVVWNFALMLYRATHVQSRILELLKVSLRRFDGRSTEIDSIYHIAAAKLLSESIDFQSVNMCFLDLVEIWIILNFNVLENFIFWEFVKI